MKTIILLAMLVPFSASAICFRTFEATGTGKTAYDAKEDAQKNADNTCGVDDFNWSTRQSEYTYTQIYQDQVVAKARFKCCGSW